MTNIPQVWGLGTESIQITLKSWRMKLLFSHLSRCSRGENYCSWCDRCTAVQWIRANSKGERDVEGVWTGKHDKVGKE